MDKIKKIGMAVLYLALTMAALNLILGLLGSAGSMASGFIANPLGFFKKTPAS